MNTSIDSIKHFLKQGESETIEFKKSLQQLRPAMETLCGFLNNKGGNILIGVNQEGKLCGDFITDNTRQEIARELKKIEPYPSTIQVNFISVGQEKSIIHLHIVAGDHAPYTYDGRPYQRIQSTTSQMSHINFEQLIINRSYLRHSWDEELIDEYTLDSLDKLEINRYIQQAVHANRIPEDALYEKTEHTLVRLNLLREGKLTRAAVVLFAVDLKSLFSHCQIKMARFAGQDKVAEFLDNQRVHGHAYKLIADASAFLRRHLPIAGFYQADQLERIDKPALPALAIREALINAICHRDYSERETTISLAIYDDRMEIWNNGILPNKLSLSDLKRQHESLPRNKLIADTFYKQGLIECWGTGTTKMVELCKRSDIPEPEFAEYSGGFSVTFRFKESISTTYKISKQPFSLSIRQEAVVALLKKHTAMSLEQIASGLEKPPSRRMLQKELNQLRQLGLVKLKGAARSSVWLLTS